MAARPIRDGRPVPASAPRNNYNSYFLPRDGIDREVITADICRYLGNDALVRPGVHNNVQGYYVTAYRNLTTAMIEDLKADSARWDSERRRNAARGIHASSDENGYKAFSSNSRTVVEYTNSDTYQSRQRERTSDDPPYGGNQPYPAPGSYQPPPQPYPPATSASYQPPTYATSGGAYPAYPPSYPPAPASDPRYPPYSGQPSYPAHAGPDMDIDMGGDMSATPYVSTGADFTTAQGQQQLGDRSRNPIRDSRDAWDPRMLQQQQQQQQQQQREPVRDPRDLPPGMRDPRDPRDQYMMRGEPMPAGNMPPQGAYDRNGVPVPVAPSGYPGYGQMNPGVAPGPTPGSRAGDYMPPPAGAYADSSYANSIPHDPLYGRAPYQDKGPSYPPSRMSNPRATAELTSPPGQGSTTPTMQDQPDFADPADPVARRSAQSPNINVTPLGTRRSEERDRPVDRDRDRDSDRDSRSRRQPPSDRDDSKYRSGDDSKYRSGDDKYRHRR
jgi:hypothetical protein